MAAMTKDIEEGQVGEARHSGLGVERYHPASKVSLRRPRRRERKIWSLILGSQDLRIVL